MPVPNTTSLRELQQRLTMIVYDLPSKQLLHRLDHALRSREHAEGTITRIRPQCELGLALGVVIEEDLVLSEGLVLLKRSSDEVYLGVGEEVANYHEPILVECADVFFGSSVEAGASRVVKGLLSE